MRSTYHRAVWTPERRAARALRPDAARPRGGRRRPVAGAVAGGRASTTRSCCAEGDRRNVVDRYRYWTVEAIVADLDTRRHDFHVAIENWRHDFNIGTIVRTANAFLAARGAHRRQPALEPARARWSPTATSTSGTTPTCRRWPSTCTSGRCAAGHRQPARLASRSRPCGCRGGVPAVRAGGPGAVGGGPRRRATGPSRSPSSGRPARSTPPRPRRSPCTPGSASMRTSTAAHSWRG